MTICATPGCDRPAKTRNRCEPHYRRRLHTGRYGYRPADRVRQHVAALRDLGWTYDGIAKAAGVSSYSVHKAYLGQSRHVLADTEAAILRVPLTPRESHRGVDATGSRRRVQALAWMGWPNRAIAERIGCTPRTLPTELSRGRVSVRLAQRITAVYDELSGLSGPSKIAAAKARQYGWAPPAAWDEDAIDDPTAKPEGVRRRAA